MCLGGGSKGTTTRSETTVSVPPWITAPYQDLVKETTSLADQPYPEYPVAERVSPFTPEELAAFGMVTQGVTEMGDPYAYESANIVRDVVGRSMYGPAPEDIEARMNPYLDQVLGRLNEQSERGFKSRLAELGDQAQRAGAFGGSRFGVQEANTFEDFSRRLQDTQASELYNAYNQAMGQYNTDLNRGLTGAGVLSDLDNAMLQQLQGRGSLLGAVGQDKRRMDQLLRDLDYEQFQEQVEWPYKQIGFEQGVLQPAAGTWAGSTTTQTTQAPKTSTFNKILGAGLSIASLAMPGGGTIGSALLGGLGGMLGGGGAGGHGESFGMGQYSKPRPGSFWAAKDGGPIRRYADGGPVTSYASIPRSDPNRLRHTPFAYYPYRSNLLGSTASQALQSGSYTPSYLSRLGHWKQALAARQPVSAPQAASPASATPKYQINWGVLNNRHSGLGSGYQNLRHLPDGGLGAGPQDRLSQEQIDLLLRNNAIVKYQEGGPVKKPAPKTRLKATEVPDKYNTLLEALAAERGLDLGTMDEKAAAKLLMDQLSVEHDLWQQKPEMRQFNQNANEFLSSPSTLGFADGGRVSIFETMYGKNSPGFSKWPSPRELMEQGKSLVSSADTDTEKSRLSLAAQKGAGYVAQAATAPFVGIQNFADWLGENPNSETFSRVDPAASLAEAAKTGSGAQMAQAALGAQKASTAKAPSAPSKPRQPVVEYKEGTKKKDTVFGDTNLPLLMAGLALMTAEGDGFDGAAAGLGAYFQTMQAMAQQEAGAEEKEWERMIKLKELELAERRVAAEEAAAAKGGSGKEYFSEQNTALKNLSDLQKAKMEALAGAMGDPVAMGQVAAAYDPLIQAAQAQYQAIGGPATFAPITLDSILIPQ